MTAPGLHYAGSWDGAFTINALTARGPAWCVLDIMALFPGVNEAKRSGNTPLPGAEGRRPARILLDEQKLSLPMVVTGRVNPSNQSAESLGRTRFEQLFLNLEQLRQDWISPCLASPWTVPYEYVSPGGDNTTIGVLQVMTITLGAHVSAETLRCSLDIVIPAGRAVEFSGGS